MADLLALSSADLLHMLQRRLVQPADTDAALHVLMALMEAPADAQAEERAEAHRRERGRDFYEGRPVDDEDEPGYDDLDPDYDGD